MKTNGEESLAAKTQGEVRVGRVVADCAVIRLPHPDIFVTHGLEPFPHKAFKLLFGQGARRVINDCEAPKELGSAAISLHEIQNRPVDSKVIPSTGH